VQRNGGEAQVAEHARNALSVGASGAEYDEGVAGQLVQNVDQVDVLEFARQKNVALLEGVDCVVLVGDLNDRNYSKRISCVVLLFYCLLVQFCEVYKSKVSLFSW